MVTKDTATKGSQEKWAAHKAYNISYICNDYRQTHSKAQALQEREAISQT